MNLKNWNVSSFTADTETTVIQPAASATAGVVSIIIHNYSGEIATIKLKVTDSSDTLKAYLYELMLSTKTTFNEDTRLFLADQDKLVMESSQANVSFFASGNES
jgi:hypothetical protein